MSNLLKRIRHQINIRKPSIGFCATLSSGNIFKNRSLILSYLGYLMWQTGKNWIIRKCIHWYTFWQIGIMINRVKAMNDIIRQLFETAGIQGDFTETDTTLNKECEKRLQPYKERLQDIGYEEIRDVIYSISYLSKQSAFEIGFKTAVKLIMECMRHE